VRPTKKDIKWLKFQLKRSRPNKESSHLQALKTIDRVYLSNLNPK
jgi:hypothetical protein